MSGSTEVLHHCACMEAPHMKTYDIAQATSLHEDLRVEIAQ